MALKIAELAAIAEEAAAESPFTRISLDDLANEDALRRQLQVEFEKHLRAKEGIQGLVDRIRRVTGSTMERARTAARTERTRSLSGNRYADVLREYLEAHAKAVRNHRKRPARPKGQWINPRTAKVPRHQHVAISGKILPIGEEFLPGLRYPGDPRAPASQVINCHCYWRRVR